jgi:nucleotide-binding universal stress UspA family protein
MNYKSILVHVAPGQAGLASLRAALALARKFEARLVGLGARAFDPMPDPGGLSGMKLKQIVETELAAAEKMFREEAGALGAMAEWRSEMDYPTAAMLRHVAAADIIVAGHGVDAAPAERQAGCADLIMAAGVPLISVPEGASLGWQSVLIGWKNMRETRRAVADALPLLKLAKTVRVVRFAADGEAPAPALDDVVARLKLHGVRAEGAVQPRTQASVAQDLIVAADAMRADLIVAGGYGHSRLREWALGGVTQGLLQKATRCVLFSH